MLMLLSFFYFTFSFSCLMVYLSCARHQSTLAYEFDLIPSRHLAGSIALGASALLTHVQIRLVHQQHQHHHQLPQRQQQKEFWLHFCSAYFTLVVKFPFKAATRVAPAGELQAQPPAPILRYYVIRFFFFVSDPPASSSLSLFKILCFTKTGWLIQDLLVAGADLLVGNV